VIVFVANNVQRNEVLTRFGLMSSSGHSPDQTTVFELLWNAAVGGFGAFDRIRATCM
jgi:hypothetical protein